MLAKTLTAAHMQLGGSAFNFGESEWIQTKLLEGGWCQSDVALLKTRLVGGGAYYVALLGPRAIQKSHIPCSEASCEANNIDESAYEIKHTHDGCNCPVIEVSTHEIAQAITNGERPLIQISPRIDLKIVTERVEYVAISHVWGDGMGNPFANGIRECQVKRLYEYLRKVIALKLSVVLWLDTLCVPSPRTEYVTARKQAIDTMRDIYSECSKVLILDADIMKSPAHVRDLELMIRVISSGWMRRLWTLQEGVLNRSQTFAQFDARAVLVDQIVDNIMHRMNDMTLGERMFTECVQAWVNIQAANQDIKSLWNEAAQFRNTSKQSDETICLATMLGLSLDSLTNISGLPSDSEVATLRMKELLRQVQRSFPVGFLFVTGERMQDNGYRWSP